MSRPRPMNIRLRQARESAGFRTATLAIEKFRWRSSTYRAHENGQNKYCVDDAEKYAEAYGVSASWLLMGDDKKSLNRSEIATKDKIDKKSHRHDCIEHIYASAILLRDDRTNQKLLKIIKNCAEYQLQKRNSYKY